MPRTRSKHSKLTASVTQVNYKDATDSSDDDHDGPGLLTNILGLLMNMQRRSAQKKKRKPARKAPKRRGSTGGCECLHCTIASPKKRCTSRKGQTKGKAKPQSSTTTDSPVNLESDEEEIIGTNITATHVDSIKNKVDTFFKALDSDEDELESKLNVKPLVPGSGEKKSKDFYTILTDSEDEIEQASTLTNTTTSSITTASPSAIPSTSTGVSSTFNSGLKFCSAVVNKAPEDLFAYVDDILNDCNVVDITNDKSKENVSLEDLKKKTEEILGGVTSLIDDLKPKPKEPEKSKEPEKEAPTCPICLETLGSSIQAMATFCGHMFCEPCISEVAKTSKKCPTCRKGVTKTKYHPVYI